MVKTTQDRHEARAQSPGSEARIGVLALQGDFEAHAAMLRAAGAVPLLVRHPAELEQVEGLVMPGGESTTAIKFLERDDFFQAIRRASEKGKAIFGTCAGAILMAGDLVNAQQPALGLLDIGIRRNAYGRQLSSFIAREASPAFPGEPLEMVFIRAPWIERVGKQVCVLAECRQQPVLVQQGNCLAATFHPELTADLRIHRYFLEIVNRFSRRHTR